MKNKWPWILIAVMGLWALSGLRTPKPTKEGFDVAAFGKLPVLLNGRVQPFDSVARNTLLNIQGRQMVYLEKFEWWQRLAGKRPKTVSPSEWLLDVMIRPEVADTYEVFRVQHPDVESLIADREKGLVYYSYNDLAPKADKLREQVMPIVEAEERKERDVQQRTPFQKDLVHLFDSMVLYQRIKNTLRPESSDDFAAELKLYQESINPGREALMKSEMGQEHDREALALFAGFFRRYQGISRFAYQRVVPPVNPEEKRDAWENIGSSLLESMRDGKVQPAIGYFASMIAGYRDRNPEVFNKAVADYQTWLGANSFSLETAKAGREFKFNVADPFTKSMAIYILAMIIACISWLNLSDRTRRAAFSLMMLAFVIHTIGLVTRMILEGRPPVTNLYSSAVFIGWGAVILGMVLERIYKEGIGTVVASLIGFVTLIIAYHLSLSGDTMAMLQAVLDTNLWLATHVVIITIGYSSMFVAGILAIIYIFRGLFTKAVTPPMAKAMSGMVYGIICFSTLCSFVGTILGGIWADQSWGRFWGWDPKENGALLIVIWCAIMLHARWGGLIRERGIMACAVFGNIVTSFSWFGVNMLGIGLHSYGFMDKAFPWLVGFMISQLIIIALALTPLDRWASFRNVKLPVEPAPDRPRGEVAPAGA